MAYRSYNTRRSASNTYKSTRSRFTLRPYSAAKVYSAAEYLIRRKQSRYQRSGAVHISEVLRYLNYWTERSNTRPWDMTDIYRASKYAKAWYIRNGYIYTRNNF